MDPWILRSKLPGRHGEGVLARTPPCLTSTNDVDREISIKVKDLMLLISMGTTRA